MYYMNSETYRPRRSLLYMPGANERAMEKARELPTDTVIFDLEDAVAPESKADARGKVLAALADGGYGHREVVIRVNALGTAWAEDDLRAAANTSGYAGGFIDHYLIPLVYPSGLTYDTQILLGLAVLFINAIIYALVWRKTRAKRKCLSH